MNVDIYHCILKFLPLEDIIKCKTLNKSFYNAIKFEPLWKHIFDNNFNNDIFKINYFETCKLCYLLQKLCNDINYKGTYEKMYNSKDLHLCNYSTIYTRSDLITFHISPQINLLTNLEFLKLENDNLTTLPSEIYQLINLKSVNLNNNQLITLSPEICQLINLQTLILENNQLITLPSEMSQLINLETLKLSNNPLIIIPSAIYQLTNLKKLFLSNTQLKEVSPEICNLRNLHLLSLSKNKLTTLPSEIGQLINLKIFYLYGDSLKIRIPRELYLIKNLEIY